jgi:hypothetical protein
MMGNMKSTEGNEEHEGKCQFHDVSLARKQPIFPIVMGERDERLAVNSPCVANDSGQNPKVMASENYPRLTHFFEPLDVEKALLPVDPISFSF